MESTWSDFPSSIALVSNTGMLFMSANLCASFVDTVIFSGASHLLPAYQNSGLEHLVTAVYNAMISIHVYLACNNSENLFNY